MKKWLVRWSTRLTLSGLAFLARRPMLTPLSQAVSQRLARATVKAKQIGQASRTSDLGPLWQRSFPAKKQVPIESASEDTVVAQIHTRCPLRGSGDLQACYRMMAFDRAIMAHVGGQLVVLQSQATPGVNHCRVAMRLKGESMNDLLPAHLSIQEQTCHAQPP